MADLIGTPAADLLRGAFSNNFFVRQLAGLESIALSVVTGQQIETVTDFLDLLREDGFSAEDARDLDQFFLGALDDIFGIPITDNTDFGGNDTVTSFIGDNYVADLLGDNFVSLGNGDDSVLLGFGDDDVFARSGDNFIRILGGNNLVSTGTGTDFIEVGEGDDQITTLTGNKTVVARGGDNFISTLSGDDRITAGSGNDFITASQGFNAVKAGDGNNEVFGGADFDAFEVGIGDDFADVGGSQPGRDATDGGLSNDLFYALDTGNVFEVVSLDPLGLALLEPDDIRAAIDLRIFGPDNPGPVGGFPEGLSILGELTDPFGFGTGLLPLLSNGFLANNLNKDLGGSDSQDGDEGDDLILSDLWAGYIPIAPLFGDPAALFQQFLGDDNITSGQGENLVIDVGGNNSILTGDFSDNIFTSSAVAAQIYYTALNAFGIPISKPENLPADDDIIAGGGNDFIYTGAGDDNVQAGQGADRIEAGLGNDRVFGGAAQDDLLLGLPEFYIDLSRFLFGPNFVSNYPFQRDFDFVVDDAGNVTALEFFTDTVAYNSTSELFDSGGRNVFDRVFGFNTGRPGAGGDLVDLRGVLPDFVVNDPSFTVEQAVTDQLLRALLITDTIGGPDDNLQDLFPVPLDIDITVIQIDPDGAEGDLGFFATAGLINVRPPGFPTDPILDTPEEFAFLADNVIINDPASAIALTKSGQFIGNPADGIQPGEPIFYTFEVANAGNRLLDDVVISDASLFFLDPFNPSFDPATWDPEQSQPIDLALQESATLFGLYFITADDILAGGFVNTAIASGTPTLADTPVTASATETVIFGPGGVSFISGNDESLSPAPVPVSAADDAYSVDEDATLTVAAAAGVLANDSGVAEVAQVTDTVDHGSLVVNADGSFTYMPDPDFNGEDAFSYEISDNGGTDVATVRITVDAVNDGPVAQNDRYSVDEDRTLAMDAGAGVLANDSDVDGDALRVGSVTDTVDHGSLVVNADGSFTYTPDPDFNGEDAFSYEVSDGDATDVATVSITVNAVNDGPVAQNDSYSVDQGVTLEIDAGTGVLANDTDIDGGLLRVGSVTDSVDHGSLLVNGDGSFTYTPDAGFSGEDAFSYLVSDGEDTGSPATVTITVNAVTPAPVPDPDIDTTVELGDAYGAPPKRLKFDYLPGTEVQTEMPAIHARLLRDNGLDDDSTAFVVASNRLSPFSIFATVAFQGEVEVGGSFIGDFTGASENSFSQRLYIHFFDDYDAFSRGESQFQTVTYNVSGRYDMFIGDEIGSATVSGYEGEDGSLLV